MLQEQVAHYTNSLVEREERLNTSKQHRQALATFASGVAACRQEIPELKTALAELKEDFAAQVNANAVQTSEQIQALLTKSQHALSKETALRNDLQRSSTDALNALTLGKFERGIWLKRPRYLLTYLLFRA